MFRLDYLSCFLTILATVLVGRRSWTGLLISIVNSLIVCLIGFRTSQFGFIPANLVCICVYAFSIRSWLKKTNTRTGSRGLSVASSATPRPPRASRHASNRPAVRHLQWQHRVSRQMRQSLIDSDPESQVEKARLLKVVDACKCARESLLQRILSMFVVALNSKNAVQSPPQMSLDQ
jgi:hypothetical protein